MSKYSIKELKEASLEDILRLIDSGDVTDAVVYTLPLDNAFSNFQVQIAGNFIACIAGTDASTTVDIEFNRVGSGSVTFTQGLNITRPFNRFFITSTAQAGKTIKFVISSYASELFAVQDNRSQGNQTTLLTTINTQLVGDATGTFASDVSLTAAATAVKVITGASVQVSWGVFADYANSDQIYLGFDNTTTNTKKMVALKAGQLFSIDNFKGDIYAYGATGTQKLSAFYF